MADLGGSIFHPLSALGLERRFEYNLGMTASLR
jgi:hypothetical protein